MAVVGSGIITQIPVDSNPLQTSTIVGPDVDLIEFIPSLNGFILSGGEGVNNRVVAFLDINNLSILSQGIFTGNTGPTGGNPFGSSKSAVDSNGDMIWFGGLTKEGIIFIRF